MFKELPLELNEAIFEYLPVKDLVKFLSYKFVYRIIKRKYIDYNINDDLNILVHYRDLILYFIDDIDKIYLMRCAACHGKLELVKYLVSLGEDPHLYNECPLLWAVRNGHLNVIKYIVSQGAITHIQQDNVLSDAVKYGRLEVVKYLVSLGADIYRPGFLYLKLVAFEYGWRSILKYLISLDKYGNGYMYLYLSDCYTGYNRIVKLLYNEILEETD